MIALFISAVVLVGALFLYRTSLFNAVLRAIAVVLLYAIITGFSLPLKQTIERTPPRILIDVSPSMECHIDTIRSLLGRLGYQHATIPFSDSLFITAADSIEPRGTSTDIIGALEAVRAARPSAVLLVSDGNHNHQDTPLSLLQTYPIPVYAFGIGEEVSQDIAVLEVVYPDYVYPGDSINIDVTVQSQGFTKGSASVDLIFHDSKKNQRRTFPLSDTKAKNTLTFRVVGAGDADTAITITVPPMPGEARTVNNTKKICLMPVNRRIQVVYYTEHLSFNTKFILQALEQDPRIDAAFVMRSSAGRLIDPRTGTDQPLPLLDTVDVLVLDNIACATLPWPRVADAVAAGLGLICLGTIQQLTPAWQTLLPISIAESIIEGSFPVTVIDGFSCLGAGKEYPPFSRVQRVLGVHEHAVTIAMANNAPVIAYQRTGHGTVFQVIGTDIGTWHFLQRGMNQKDVLSSLLPDIIRFIAPGGRNKRLVLEAAPRSPMVNERVDLVARSYDLDFRRAGGGDFWIDIYGRRIPFFESQPGIYRTSFVIDQPGDILLAASGTFGNEFLASDTLRLNARESDLEQMRTLNHALLNEIVRHTGGAVYPLDSLPGFSVPETRAAFQTSRIDLNNPIGYLLVVVLFVIDWIVRRRRGTV